MGVLLLAMALLPFFLSAWQWRRAEARTAALAAYDAAARRAPVPVLSLPAEHLPQGERVSLAGPVVGAPAWLDNVTLNERHGALLLYPVRLADHSIILVAPGWVETGRPIALPPLPAALTGRWVGVPRHFTLPGAVAGSSGRVDALDAHELSRRLGGVVRPGVVALDAAPAPLATWSPRPPYDPSRHAGYALQWLLMGGCLMAAGFYRLRRRA
ncbi:SURF1 family cytochrome oxidase biogenesis protein [Paludibacterium paludis]|uniref:SURF1-like protein n=1 Tax=Paludibacterium paludis TaxID=1225769 RepID=A0A918U9T2_9NEIS|nr:SURF1 family cytochrome oxidase biogenesis protein [Paludibacterium paludis]GGY15483.1 hypothetical protein GCM10011289_18420 [Paludibacterium paludis]